MDTIFMWMGNGNTTRINNVKKFNLVEPNASIESAVQKMWIKNIRRTVVLEDENLVGVITQTDLREH